MRNVSHLRVLPILLLGIMGIFLMNCQSQESLNKVLIIQDELPQLKALAPYLQQEGNLNVTVVEQAVLPEDFSIYQAILLFIHGELEQKTEMKIIEYTRDGGRLVVLHHSISSGKAENKYYFDFLGIHLSDPEKSSGPVQPGGGYGWKHQEANGDGVTLTLTNLHKDHYITNHNVQWPDTIQYRSSDFPSVEKEYPALHLQNSEVYLNHKFTDGRQKVVLMGLKYYDDRVNHQFMQDRAGWIKPRGEGEIIYLMPGQSAEDYRNPNIAQIVLNAINWQQQ